MKKARKTSYVPSSTGQQLKSNKRSVTYYNLTLRMKRVDSKINQLPATNYLTSVEKEHVRIYYSGNGPSWARMALVRANSSLLFLFLCETASCNCSTSGTISTPAPARYVPKELIGKPLRAHQQNVRTTAILVNNERKIINLFKKSTLKSSLSRQTRF